MIRILGHLDLFELSKVSYSGKKARDQYFEENKGKMSGSNFEPSQNQMHMLARDMVSFDDLFSHITIPPVWNIFICKSIRLILWLFKIFHLWLCLFR